MFKYLIASIMAVSLSISSIYVIGNDKQSYKEEENIRIESTSIEKEPSTMLTDIDSISVKENIVVDNISVPLYATFDSPDLAIQNVASNSVVKLIQDTYQYDDINSENWKEYYESMYELLDSDLCPEWYTEENDDYRILRKFFDIYENEEKNTEIVCKALTVKTVENLIQDTDFLELLPYDSYEALDQELNILTEDRASTSTNVIGFDIDKGIKYASNYATSPNTSDYKKFSSDCTNFVSQILENGGVAQEKYDDESKGWWHKKSKVLFVTVHKQSISWVRADTFAKYMGVTYTTTDNSTFSAHIKKGDFISADFENDGDWDHMGFVTDRKTSKSNGYYDYKVAQHTSNYHEWVSSSKNNWEMVGEDGGKYGRVRR